MSRPPKLLIVDDGERYAEMAFQFLRGYRYATRCTLAGSCWSCTRRSGCTLTHAHDAVELDQALARHADLDAVLLDLAFDLPPERLLPSNEPDEERRRRFEGLAILAHLRQRQPSLPVILMTSREELAYEEAASALDVDEYVTLAGADSFDARAVGLLIERVLARAPQTGTDERYAWGKSPAMARLKREAKVLARTSLPVLVLGETGTGKSALAEHVIHTASGRKGPFVSVDLSALPGNLASAELFGTARGAFSDAVDRPGRFERAHNGTLFLDEIGNLPLDTQRLLLLALEAGRVTRLGESSPRAVDVRVVAATNADLAAAIRAGAFRADLYARLNPSTRLKVPPLRDRMDDLSDLMGLFITRAFRTNAHRALLDEYAAAHGLPAGMPAQLALGRLAEAEGAIVFSWAGPVASALRAYPWPGNLRELDHVTTAASVFALADALEAAKNRRGDAEKPHWIPIPARLVRDLLASPSSPTPAAAPTAWAKAATLHNWVTGIESRLLRNLFEESNGDFEAMAERVLTGSPARNARRVRLRFNQLGLRARRARGRSE